MQKMHPLHLENAIQAAIIRRHAYPESRTYHVALRERSLRLKSLLLSEVETITIIEEKAREVLMKFNRQTVKQNRSIK